MTWEELSALPDEIAQHIELWDGRVVWLRRGPHEHQEFTNLRAVTINHPFPISIRWSELAF